MYYIYHIPGKKIGVTRNLKNRVTLIQGYKEGEYEVLDSSEDINYISEKEIELQHDYGYKIDRQKYSDLKLKQLNFMKINVTTQTTTFPCETADLKKVLDKNLKMEWVTDLGIFSLNKKSIKWICKNAKTSMYNSDRCYIYNKAFYEDLLAEPPIPLDELFNLIRKWADDRGIYAKGDSKTQLIKLYEEIGELSEAVLKEDQLEIIDAIGDAVVVLTNFAELTGNNIETCIRHSYDQIVNRTGSMQNGTFVKNTL
jgi:NTP pyrophosphatase (non-canonical NTP hydrolase)